MSPADPQMQNVEELLSQLNLTVGSLKQNNSEIDRVAALKVAREVVLSLQKPHDAILNLTFSPTQITSVRIGIDLGIFTTLTERDTPVSLEELAAVKGADLTLMERTLRLLAGIGYVTEHGTRVYVANAITRQMTTHTSIGAVRFLFDTGMPIMAKMPEYFRQQKFQSPPTANDGPFQYAHTTKESLWEWLLVRPELMDAANSYFQGDRGHRPNWVDWFPVQERIIDGFQGGNDDILFVDMAGGRGHDLVAFHRKFPDAPGRLILQDLPHVVAEANVVDKIECQAFDLFKPKTIQGARTYYMKFILHDWSDEECQQILRSVWEVMKKGYSKLYIEEFIVPDKDAGVLVSMWDWEMLAFCGSMERTRDHWEKLLTSAGFNVQFWFPPGDGTGIIEAEMA